MLEIVGAGASGKSTQDWHEVWKGSEESKEVQKELDRIHLEKRDEAVAGSESVEGHREFAVPFLKQLLHVTIRVFQQYWRTPSYIWGKLLLGVMSALFISFSFYKSDNSQQGLQDSKYKHFPLSRFELRSVLLANFPLVIFSIFMLTAIFSSLVQQIMPRFVIQRSLYEVRERPSKAYSWAAFIIANITVEIPWQMLLGILVYASYYYGIFGVQSSERQGLILLFCMQFFVFASTFAQMLIAALPDAATAGNIATIMFSLTLTFNGVMQPPQALPGFWIFMYRVSPLTYLVDGVAATGMHGRTVVCALNELSRFNPPTGQTCQAYLANYLKTAPGQLMNPMATSQCEYCPLTTSDQFLASVAITWSARWRNYGIGFAYIAFNIVVAILLYYTFRVSKWDAASIKKGPSKFLASLASIGYWARSLLVGHRGKVPEQGTKAAARTDKAF